MSKKICVSLAVLIITGCSDVNRNHSVKLDSENSKIEKETTAIDDAKDASTLGQYWARCAADLANIKMVVGEDDRILFSGATFTHYVIAAIGEEAAKKAFELQFKSNEAYWQKTNSDMFRDLGNNLVSSNKQEKDADNILGQYKENLQSWVPSRNLQNCRDSLEKNHAAFDAKIEPKHFIIK